MHVNYFDFGVCSGDELHWMVNHYFPQLGVEDYSAYGFEASSHRCENLNKFFENNDQVEIIHRAIADSHDESVRLYHSENTVGHSIFSTKNNVNVLNYEDVQSIIFSEWLKDNVIDLSESFNILRTNMEGAEWYLFNDLVENDLVKYFSVFLGTGYDIDKISELENFYLEYENLLKSNNIEILRFTEHRPENNADVFSILDAKLDEVL